MHALEEYLRELTEIRATGAAVPETSYYPALSNLLDTIGRTLSPRVRPVMNLQDRGAGLPDGGLFTADQFQHRGREIRPGQLPSRGAIEVKPARGDAWITADGEQVTRYWGEYGLVLVTNYRDFVLVGRDREGDPVKLETFRLAANEREFWRRASHARVFASEIGERFVAFLRRALMHTAPLTNPADVAWYLAAYAVEARERIAARADIPALHQVREALERALGITFTPERGRHFFHSSLVQTLFYGVFSSWVLWSRRHDHDDREARFDWREAAWDLHVPMIVGLYDQIATPTTLRPLGLEEVLNWTGEVLNRIDRRAFFERFEDDDAVQHFYEPFLEEFDPELRKQLGVWYTPREVVRYQVARVDWVLRHELNVPDGLADSNVVILDPCCGTGAYLIECLRTIHRHLEARGDALSGADLKRAALSRVFGFELLPAPFVVAHLQLGLALQHFGAPLAAEGTERVPVFLTNALTGWEPTVAQQQAAFFPALEQERELADGVKRDKPILVIIGNPPYDNYAKVARMAEERELSRAYRRSRRTRQPRGQGLNDLYVRFFRMAERRIVDMTGRGVVCFISNYSWLDRLSHPAMRERYLEAFDSIRIDSLNGDRNRTGKLTPSGEPDPSVFSTSYNREGIKVGTAISLLVRRPDHQKVEHVLYRDLWGTGKLAQLDAEAAVITDDAYTARLRPEGALGLPFVPVTKEDRYLEWPLLPEIFPASFAGVKTSRDAFLVDIDRDRLAGRVEQYFDAGVSHDAMRAISSCVMTSGTRFNAQATREELLERGLGPGRFERYAYRPFDHRWLYWDPDTKLLDEKRSDYVPHVFPGNLWIEARESQVMDWFDRGAVVSVLGDNLGNGLSSYFPLYLSESDTVFGAASATVPHGPNLSGRAQEYLAATGATPRQMFAYTAAILNAPAYRESNAGALRLDWPRVPLPAEVAPLEAMAMLGESLIQLFDPLAAVHGVNTGTLRSDLAAIGVITPVSGGSLDPTRGDLRVSMGWGRFQEGTVFPGPDSSVERDYTTAERDSIASSAEAMGMALDELLALLGQTTVDVPLNSVAFWGNVPKKVWDYTQSGYAVLKKWLSYREYAVLRRDLLPAEARYFRDTARRIAAILSLGPRLNRGYENACREQFAWRRLSIVVDPPPESQQLSL